LPSIKGCPFDYRQFIRRRSRRYRRLHVFTDLCNECHALRRDALRRHFHGGPVFSSGRVSSKERPAEAEFFVQSGIPAVHSRTCSTKNIGKMERRRKKGGEFKASGIFITGIKVKVETGKFPGTFGSIP